MVKLLVGRKGSGKTKQMIDLANERTDAVKGDVIFINKNHRLTFDLKHSIRVICMEDFPNITNSDEYIGFLYGIISSNHDIETIFIDGILKHANISSENMPRFIERLKNISKRHDVNFYLSISAEKDQLNGIDLTDCALLN